MRRDRPAPECIRLGAGAGLAMMGWLSLVLWLDRAGGGGGLGQQRTLGVATWVVLLAALRRVPATVLSLIHI